MDGFAVVLVVFIAGNSKEQPAAASNSKPTSSQHQVFTARLARFLIESAINLVSWYPYLSKKWGKHQALSVPRSYVVF